MPATAPAEHPLVTRVQELTEQLDAIVDLQARALADELAGAIVGLYGEGLERIFAALARDDARAQAIREELAGDGVVASLMLIHGLYPVDLRTRVDEALERVRPYLESHGGDVEVTGLQDGVLRLRLQGSCRGCAASQSTLELAIEQALLDAAPDLLGLEVEGLGATPPSRASMAPGEEADWVALNGASHVERGATAVEGDLLVANVAGTLLAYRDRCAGCGGSLAQAVLIGGTLACAECGARFDLPRAGRGKDDEALQLEPVPLLRSGGGEVRVARGR